MKSDLIYVDNILKSILLIEKYLKNVSLADFRKNSLLVDAVSKRIEEIGENAGKVSKELKLKHKDIDWRGLVENRHFLVHVYSLVNVQRVYSEAVNELPLLKKDFRKLRRLLDE